MAVLDPVGAGNTKSGAADVPVTITICEVAPAALTVTVAVSSAAPVGLKVMVMLHVAFTPTLVPQVVVAVKFAAFWPLTTRAMPESGIPLLFCRVSVC